MVKLADLLKEYSDEQRRKYLNKIGIVLSNFTTHAARDSKADPYINAALELFPSLRYTGKLYRVMGIDPETFLGFKSNTDVLSYLKNYKTKHYQSFAKTLNGLEDFESVVLSGDLEDNYPTVAVYVEQFGSGLDVETFYETRDSLVEFNIGGGGGLESAARVGEVIAPIDKNTMQIGMYVLHDNPENRMYKYNSSNFSRLKRDIETSLQNYERQNSEDWDYDDESDARQGFKDPNWGNLMYTDKSINKKSKYKGYNPSW